MRKLTKDELQQAIRDQWLRYDKALADGLPYVAIVQINKKLVRLENQLESWEG